MIVLIYICIHIPQGSHVVETKIRTSVGGWLDLWATSAHSVHIPLPYAIATKWVCLTQWRSIHPRLDGPKAPEWLDLSSKCPRGGRTRGPFAQGSNHPHTLPSVLGGTMVTCGQECLKRFHLWRCLFTLLLIVCFIAFIVPDFLEEKQKVKTLAKKHQPRCSPRRSTIKIKINNDNI